MKDILKELEDIAEKLDTINSQMNDEERVWAEELADRKRQGLTGDAAVKHYNDWMDQGMLLNSPQGFPHRQVSNITQESLRRNSSHDS